jgi:NAD-dependent dihydropyrimidine dehydrogenase PreA subunit
MSWLNVPREMIPWYPIIDESKCIGCGACVRFCKNGVFVLERNPPKAKVVNPYNCVVGCSACDKICPQGAISHPDIKEVVAMLRRAGRA